VVIIIYLMTEHS